MEQQLLLVQYASSMVQHLSITMILASLPHNVLSVTMSTLLIHHAKIALHSVFSVLCLLSVQYVRVDFSWMEHHVWLFVPIPLIVLLILHRGIVLLVLVVLLVVQYQYVHPVQQVSSSTQIYVTLHAQMDLILQI